MESLEPFEFHRGRGIVWVCDIVNSSHYLNSDISKKDIENFLPRFYYFSKILVESYGATIFKWTGDGFMAFFEMTNEENEKTFSGKIFEAANHLTFASNVTQLGLNPSEKILVRHAVTYENNGLIIANETDKSRLSLDIIGRSVVLAFRLSSIQAEFPSIITVNELTEISNRNFIPWAPNHEELLKYFKGEVFGTTSLMVSVWQLKETNLDLNQALDNAKSALSKATGPTTSYSDDPMSTFITKIFEGPDWCIDVVRQHAKFINNEMLEILKNLINQVEDKNGE